MYMKAHILYTNRTVIILHSKYLFCGNLEDQGAIITESSERHTLHGKTSNIVMHCREIRDNIW